MDSHDQNQGSSAIARLGTNTTREWKQLHACAVAAGKKREEIALALSKERLIPADCAFVTFGSLARDEFTEGSDIDWTLLVDGLADPQHLPISQQIGRKLDQLGVKRPGPTAVFGGLAFSHEIIHLIGGDADSNKNTTRRVLLLLESHAIKDDVGVRDRVLRHILGRYLEEDHGPQPDSAQVPRFLLNDIVRFWRTMAVDYAAKRRERGGSGWAIRNFKLRMSRKLIFAAGLAMCLSCKLRPSAEARALAPDSAPGEVHDVLVADLLRFASRTPLEILAQFALDFGAADSAAAMFDDYDRFLGILRDPAKRSELEKLEPDDTMSGMFAEAREISRSFHEALTKLFFSTNDELTDATQHYGVF